MQKMYTIGIPKKASQKLPFSGKHYNKKNTNIVDTTVKLEAEIYQQLQKQLYKKKYTTITCIF